MRQFYLPINCPRAVCNSRLLGCHFSIFCMSRSQSISSYYFPNSNMLRDQITDIKFVFPRISFTKMLLGQGAFSSIINCQVCFWWHLVRFFFLIFFLGYCHILQAKLQQYMNHELPDVQADFRKGRGTRDQIANICWIIEKSK